MPVYPGSLPTPPPPHRPVVTPPPTPPFPSAPVRPPIGPIVCSPSAGLRQTVNTNTSAGSVRPSSQYQLHLYHSRETPQRDMRHSETALRAGHLRNSAAGRDPEGRPVEAPPSDSSTVDLKPADALPRHSRPWRPHASRAPEPGRALARHRAIRRYGPPATRGTVRPARGGRQSRPTPRTAHLHARPVRRLARLHLWAGPVRTTTRHHPRRRGHPRPERPVLRLAQPSDRRPVRRHRRRLRGLPQLL